MSKKILLLGLVLFCQSVIAEAALVSIIIDDMGYRLRDDERALKLPGNITYAVMPFSPNVERISTRLKKQHKDIILHMPMESQQQEQNQFLGPGALTHNMNRQDFQQTIQRAITSVPDAIGMNNHMGSLISRNGKQMQWLMETLKSYRMFYVDSVTIDFSQAKRAAKRYSVPYIRRDVFLDHKQDENHIHEQFDLLIDTARRKGIAVAIGHPRPETLAVLEKRLPGLEKYRVKLVPVTELLGTKHGHNLVHQFNK